MTPRARSAFLLPGAQGRGGDSRNRWRETDLVGQGEQDEAWPSRLLGWRRHGQVRDLFAASFGELGPGYMHFPIGGMVGEEYFRQLTSEEVQTRYAEGRPYRVWTLPGGKRNEGLETTVYALAARSALPYRLNIVSSPKPPGPKLPAPITTMAEIP